jgi:hypothetical protein
MTNAAAIGNSRLVVSPYQYLGVRAGQDRCLNARQHATKVATAKNVYVKMQDLLMRCRPGIGEYAITALNYALFPGNPAQSSS